MLEINGSHIAQLNDTDLRTLVALLCEAELRHRGFPVSAVTAGGDQNAADGGLDVRVELPPGSTINGFIPRPLTGFQVKVPDMPRAKILSEMRPGGTVRRVIQELAAASGSYVIVSAKGSTTNAPLQRRRGAMRAAITGVPNAESLALDFYDRERLATWVRDHPGMIAWVREKIGQPIPGWRPYASWASPGESTEAEYLFDDKTRLLDGSSIEERALSITEGLRRIRSVLAQRKGIVRLIGLSGLGKTRLAQALFDTRIGSDFLEPALAIYTDISEPSEPAPADTMRRLIQNRQRAIIVVDNCSPSTHSTLAKVCAEQDSLLSLLTIEYDVSDDEPEGTEVFKLEPASDDIMDRLLERRFPHISQVDRHHIAEFSCGNARIALALAQTVTRGESIATLTNKELFERLFHQRNPQDPNLMRAAEVCSLVYSFNGEVLEGDAAELPFLSSLAEMSVDQLYRCVSDLYRRDLIQRRGQWRAVLPHAIANRLATHALEGFPPQRISTIFTERASDRLLQSFSKRLGYLHDCEAAQQIVRLWLSDGGELSDLRSLSGIGIAMFRNVAPVAPETVLDVIGRTVLSEDSGEFLDVSNRGRDTYISLLYSLAYDPTQFERAAGLLARFVLVEPQNYRNKSARERFLNLFQLYLSGTHATIEQRLGIVDCLLSSGDERSIELGLDAIDALLEAVHFSSSYGFDFGARSRNYGWHPKNRDEVVAWYREILVYVQRLALSDMPFADRVLSILANNFRGLWSKAAVIDELETMARTIAGQDFWPEGWIAVRNTIRFDIADMLPEHAEKIRMLEVELRPSGLLEKVHAYVFSKSQGALDVADGDPDEVPGAAAPAHERAEEVACQLGHEVARNIEVLKTLLPDLVGRNVHRGWSFGRGLGMASAQLNDMWLMLVDALIAVPEKERDVQVLRGFLNAANTRDPVATATILDNAITHPVLGYWFPVLQASFAIEQRGAERLEAALRVGLSPSWTYRYLSYGRVMVTIPPSTLRRIIIGIVALSAGYGVAIDVFGMWLHNIQSSSVPLDAELVRCGRELVLQCSFDQSQVHMLDYHLGEIADSCFSGPDASDDAASVCGKLRDALINHQAYPYDYKFLLGGLFRAQPLSVLAVFMEDQLDEGQRLLEGAFRYERENPVDSFPDDVLISWAQTLPSEYFPGIAAIITPFRKAHEHDSLEWTPLAMRILGLAPDRLIILEAFSRKFYPSIFSGSLADILEGRRALLQDITSHSDPAVVAWVRTRDEALVRQIESERLLERRIDARFE